MDASPRQSRIDGEHPTAARRGTYARLLRYSRHCKGPAAFGVVCSSVTAIATLLFGGPFRDVTKASIDANLDLLDRGALALVVLFFGRWLFQYGQLYMLSQVAQTIGRHLRSDLYGHLQSLPVAFFDRRRSGHLLSVMSNDVMLVQNTIGRLGPLFGAPVQALGAVILMCLVNWQLTLVALVLLPVMFVFINNVGRRIRAITGLVQLGLADLTRATEESVAGARVVKAFGMETREAERFDETNLSTYRSAMRAVRRMAFLTPTLELLGSGAIAFILWFGGRQIAAGTTTYPDLMLFVFYLWAGLYMSVKNLGNLQVAFQQAYAAADRIFELMDQETEVLERAGARALDGVGGRVSFEDVGFRYGDEEKVLDGISFEVEPGRTVALVGPSGAGKTTIAGLLPRFYDVQEGRIAVDGIDIRDVTLKSLRAAMAIVPQDTMVFGGTVRENIAYGKPDATDEEIQAAARAANAHSFIVDLPDGYDTVVGDRGCLLSGGQRQRIAIARALLRDPKILILDEATSSLDAESEVLVQEALEQLMESRTTLVIAHRLSTVKKADAILVLDHGRIVESGTHEELLRRQGIYSRLCASQLGDADAAGS